MERKANGPMEESIARIAKPAADLEFVGKRIVPGKTVEALFREHEERYIFAGQFVHGKDVLDVACGTGVGTSFLRAAGARRVWGLDIDPEAIRFAKARYVGCEFAQSDATNLCLTESSVDVVVSFETLEHLTDPAKFLRECRRVLRRGGMLICSTPNLGISRWGPDNPFHIREFSVTEFRELVESVFSSAELFGQRNRMFLPYVGRKIILRVLERLHLKGIAAWVLRRKPAAGPARAEFVNDQSGLGDSILAYRGNFLRQPTFLIVVARGIRTDSARE